MTWESLPFYSFLTNPRSPPERVSHILLCIILVKKVFTYLFEGQGSRRTDRETAVFFLQTAINRAGSGQSQDTRTGLPIWMTETQAFGPFSDVFQAC